MDTCLGVPRLVPLVTAYTVSTPPWLCEWVVIYLTVYLPDKQLRLHTNKIISHLLIIRPCTHKGYTKLWYFSEVVSVWNSCFFGLCSLNITRIRHIIYYFLDQLELRLSRYWTLLYYFVIQKFRCLSTTRFTHIYWSLNNVVVKRKVFLLADFKGRL